MEQEDEPRLKYVRLGCDLTDVLAAGAATCLAVSDKVLALATTAGTVHLLDYEGNQARQRSPNSFPPSCNDVDSWCLPQWCNSYHV